MRKGKNKQDLGIKLGSDEMVFWRNIIEAKKVDLRVSEENLKFYKFIIENAKKEYEKAEQEYTSNA